MGRRGPIDKYEVAFGMLVGWVFILLAITGALRPFWFWLPDALLSLFGALMVYASHPRFGTGLVVLAILLAFLQFGLQFFGLRT